MLVGTSQSIVEKKKQSQRPKKLDVKKIMMANTLGLFSSLIHLKIVSYGNIFFNLIESCKCFCHSLYISSNG